MSVFASRWVRLCVSAGLLMLVVWFADWRAIWQALRTVDAKWVGLAAVLAFADRWILTYRWDLLLAVRGVYMRFASLFRIQLAANFLGSFLPSSVGVDAVRIAALIRAGHPATEVVATTLVDRASIVFGTFVFGSVTILWLAGARLPANLAWIVLAITAVTICACVVMLQPAVRAWLASVLRPRLPARMRDRVTEVARATLAYRHEPRRLSWVAIVTAGVFVLRIFFAKSLTMACGIEIAILDLLLVIPVLWIVVMVPITVGGIGLQEAGYVALMGILGIPPAIAVTMSLIEHVVSRAVSLPGILFVADVTGGAASTARQS